MISRDSRVLISETKEKLNEFKAEVASDFGIPNYESIDKDNLNASKIRYAELGESQENKVRELEKQFNMQFNTDYYFMVMKKDK